MFASRDDVPTWWRDFALPCQRGDGKVVVAGVCGTLNRFASPRARRMYCNPFADEWADDVPARRSLWPRVFRQQQLEDTVFVTQLQRCI